MNDFALVRKNLFRKKLRAALMLVSIVVAFAIFGVVAGFDRAFNAGRDAAADDHLVVVNKVNYTRPMPVAHANRIRGVEGVRQLTYISWLGGYYQDSKNLLNVLAAEPQTYMDLYNDNFAFTPEMRQAFVRERTGAIVGDAMAQKWGWKVGDHVPISSNIFAQMNGSRIWDITIVGTFSSRKPEIDTNLMIFQWDYLNESRSIGKDTVVWIVLQTASPSVNDRVAKTIDETFANSSFETSTDTEKAFRAAFAAQFGNIAMMVELVVGTAFLTILMIVGNTMVMAVRERTREIAVLKTLGFSGVRVLRLVLGESVLLALLGGLPGLGLAVVVTWFLRDSRVSNFFPGISVTPDVALVAVALMLCLGIATGLLPALKALRLNIAAALGRG